MSRYPTVCIVCRKRMQQGLVQSLQCVEFTGTPCAASRFNAKLASDEVLVLGICDDCLAERHDVVKVHRRIDGTSYRAEWDPDQNRRLDAEADDTGEDENEDESP